MRHVLAILAAAPLLALIANAASAQDAARPAVGSVESLNVMVNEFFDTREMPNPFLGGLVYVRSGFETTDGRLSLHFLQDRSVVKMGPATKLVVAEAGPTPKGYRFTHDLQRGKIRVLVKGADVDVKTPTSWTLTHSTDFVVVATEGRTEIISLNGQVEVRADPARGRPVYLDPSYMTVVERGQPPTKPSVVSESTLRTYLDDIEFIGGGVPESQTVGHPLLTTGIDGREPTPDVGLPGESFPLHDPSPGDLLDPPFVPDGGINVNF
jgi:hypothetical protein